MQQPYWPPGPSETEEWQRILEERPDLAPAVDKLAHTKHEGHEKGMQPKAVGADSPSKKEAQPEILRMADGSAGWLELANTYRSERLQALGNGVVPLTGAIALKVLFERLMNARS
jgi:hypothetical protein